ncbi:hypothetical protein AG1IA_08846 [Rhizoctonia solani AG-1 IA]|uniref:Uncharacterized protein n=1 Tax=Thanatephorus cucumeris (strain AG1-IA) TaxID=983506 RepID=L8WGR2_THACA|nr:hypothetical protein AG1IA_08846 [Rhizoctonia solani AG-1 IA]
MKLAEHVFAAQMGEYLQPILPASVFQHHTAIARYRNKYSLGVFREVRKIIFTPPVLPEHVPVKLQSITEAPADEDLTKVHSALRAYEQFSNDNRLLPLTKLPRRRPRVGRPPSMLVLVPRLPHLSHENRKPIYLHQTLSFTWPCRSQTTWWKGSVKRWITLARFWPIFNIGLKSGRQHCEDYQTDALTNKKGELPVMCGLPALRFKWKGSWIMADMSDAQLAKYLQFYDIGDYLIDDGELPTIKGGMTAAAHDLLWWYFRSRLH